MNIILLGFMGAGKTAVGRKLSLRLGYRFLDTDHLIEEEQQKQIKEIFAESGEAHFRSLETECIKGLQGVQNTVISTGGGIITTEGNLGILKGIGTTIFLRADFEVIKDRVFRNDKRPLLQTENPLETMKALYEKRLPLYEQADLIIDTGHQKVQQVISKIIRAL